MSTFWPGASLAGCFGLPDRQMLRAALLSLVLAAAPALGESIRVATFNASLSRSGAGVLINDLIKGEDAQIDNVVAILQHVRPDIVLVNEVDFDTEGRAVALLVDRLSQTGNGISYPHHFTSPPNTGQLSGFDLNDDGKTGGPEDAYGYGRFPGQYGMVLLSRYPIAEARTFARLLWKDVPGAQLPVHPDGSPFPGKDAQDAMRLSSKSHWDVTLEIPQSGPLHIFASHPTPPVFDGPEDRNGLRNRDEIRFWSLYLDGEVFRDDNGRSAGRANAPFVILGDLNADPRDGDGKPRGYCRASWPPTGS